ncbi:hypothetical protein Droror1_Dr00008910 [Drosera rotundifolia]
MANSKTVIHSGGKMEKERGLDSLDGRNRTHHVEDGEVSGSIVYPFDYSVENHFMMMDTISKLCGETMCDAFEEANGGISIISQEMLCLFQILGTIKRRVM